MPSNPDPQPEEEISLDALAQAFAEVLGGESGPQSPSPGNGGQDAAAASGGLPASKPPEPVDAGRPDPDLSPPDDSDSCEISPRSILEAMLFVGCPGDQPLAPAHAAELMRGVEPGEIPTLVEELNRRYDAASCPYHVVSEGAGYRLTLRPEFEGLRAKFYGRVREARLSQAAVDVLAIVAYRQPVTSEEVSLLRDMPSSAILSQLVRRQLLRIERTEEKPRRTLYHTTDRFLKLFRLESLSDLPQSEELEGR